MTEYANSIFINDGPNLDAFGRLRVSNPLTLFSNTAVYGNNPYFWDYKVSGGAVTEIANQSSVRISTGGTTSGNYAIRQSHYYIPYLAGKSQQILVTFCMGASQTNSHTRVGYFDENNGIFLERGGAAGNVVKLVQRTYTSGSISDGNYVLQSNWNIDPMNGTGPSGLTLDLTKTQILAIDLQWLGVGRVRIGFVVNGALYYVHQFLNTNNNFTVVYMQYATLPVRLEVWNDATAGGTLTCDSFCAAVLSEGLFEPPYAVQFSANNGYTPVTVTTPGTMYLLLAIRPITSFSTPLSSNSVTNRSTIVPASFVVTNTGSNIIYYEIRLNPTISGSPSWSSVNTNSMTQYTVGNGTITSTGGTLLQSGYCSVGITVGGADPLYETIGLTYTDLNSVQDTCSIAATSVTSTSAAVAAFNWQEVY